MQLGHGPSKDAVLNANSTEPGEPFYSDSEGSVLASAKFKYLGLNVHGNVVEWYNRFPDLLTEVLQECKFSRHPELGDEYLRPQLECRIMPMIWAIVNVQAKSAYRDFTSATLKHLVGKRASLWPYRQVFAYGAHTANEDLGSTNKLEYDACAQAPPNSYSWAEYHIRSEQIA